MKPYIVPFALYLILIQLAAYYPDSFALIYPAIVVVVGSVTFWVLRGRHLIQPHRHIGAGVMVGLVGILLWIVLCNLKLEESIAAYLPSAIRPQPRVGFDPFSSLSEPALRWIFIGFRIAGLAILVPVVEEVFWRGFLLRWLIAADWDQQPLGTFTPLSFSGVTLLFTLAHPEWVAAAVYCALLNGLIYWRRNLWDCIVAHAVSNFTLAVYILCTGNWELW